MADQHEIELAGCTPEPLISYLKAIGVLRLVAEQVDPKARGAWKNGVFVLRSTLNREGLVEFFEEVYKPTPIVVPWTGNDFFAVASGEAFDPVKDTPTGSRIIQAFLATTSDRFANYRAAIRACIRAMADVEIVEKADMKGSDKAAYLSRLRAIAPEPTESWIDAAAVITTEKPAFSALLGSGGGSDGNTHFSDNFMQNLWEMLPDFDVQRVIRRNQASNKNRSVSVELLAGALFDLPTSNLVKGRTSALFDAGAVGGPNAGQGCERDSFANPWNIILGLEGTVCLGGALTKRSAAPTAAPAFPFQFQLTVTGHSSADGNENAGREMWLPLWNRSLTFGELAMLVGEARAEIRRRPARRAVDMARAAASLGVDRGIVAFNRYAIVRGRVGGDKYNTAASLGEFDVRDRKGVDLLRELDLWLDDLRRACLKEAPPRLSRALRRIDAAILEFCRFGETRRFAAVVGAIGNAERVLAGAQAFCAKKEVSPLRTLSHEWLDAANDESVEFELASALAGLHDPGRKIGPVRANLEPVDWKRWSRQWADKERSVVWNSADLSTNLIAVLSRRLMDGTKQGCESLPIGSRRTARLPAVSSFIAGNVDDHRIEELLWGLVLVNSNGRETVRSARPGDDALPRVYALMKLLFLPGALAVAGTEVEIPPDPEILALLSASRAKEACQIAVRRLRATGLRPLPHRRVGARVWDTAWTEAASAINPRRLAASLLFPTSRKASERLLQLVTRRDEDSKITISQEYGDTDP